MRYGKDARQVQDLTPIRNPAIAVVCLAFVSIAIARSASACVVRSRINSYAMGPCVICAKRSGSCPALNRKQHAVIMLRTGILSDKEISVLRSFYGIQQREQPPRGGVACCRARSGCHANRESL